MEFMVEKNSTKIKGCQIWQPFLGFLKLMIFLISQILSDKSARATSKRIIAELRRMQIHMLTWMSIKQLTHELNPKPQGFISYYRIHGGNKFKCILHLHNIRLLKWVRWRHKLKSSVGITQKARLLNSYLDEVYVQILEAHKQIAFRREDDYGTSRQSPLFGAVRTAQDLNGTR